MIQTTPARVGFLLACAIPVWAEGPPSDSAGPVPAPAPTPPSPVPPPPAPDRQLERYRERLSLTPEQAERVRGILDASRQQEEASRKKAESQIRELLTEGQRAAYDEMQKSPDGGGSRRGSSGRWMGPSLEDLQRELDLTPEQHEQIGAHIQSAIDVVRKRFEEARAGGFQETDWVAIRAEAEKLYNETSEKVKAALTPDQLPRYAKLLEERSRILRHVFRRPETPAERVARAMEALKIGAADEAAAVKYLVEQIVARQGELAEHDRLAREQVGELLKAEGQEEKAVRDRLLALRRDRQALEDRRQKTQQELNQVVTVRQELELIQLGLLR